MKIKPCPFCGHDPKVRPTNPSEEGAAWGMVYCVNMECPAKPIVQDGEEVADDRGSEKYIEAAIKRWNTRK